MKASTLLFSLTSILVLSACGSDASLGSAGTPVDNTKTGSGGSAGSDPAGSGGSSSSSTGGSTSSGTGGSMSTGAGGSTSGGTGGATSGGTGGSPAGDGGEDVKDAAPGTDCTVAGDCRLFDDYCGGCACDALPAKASAPKCDKGMVQCLVQPCLNKTASCSNGKCVAK